MRYGGGIRKENVGISNDKHREKRCRRKTKDSCFYVNQNRVSRDLRSSREANPMGNRLIFRYLCILRRGDEEA